MHKTPALERAKALALAMGANLHIVAFDYVEGVYTAGLVSLEALASLRRDYVTQHRKWLEEHAVPLRNLGIVVSTEVVWVEHVLEDVLAHVNKVHIDLVIKDVEHELLLMRAMFTPLDLHLLHNCRVPLHFVAKSPHANPRRIVAAVDLLTPESQYPGVNDQILSAALTLGLQCEAQVDVVYAYDLSSIDAPEYDAAGASMEFMSNLSQTLFESQSDAFSALAERNSIAAEHRHLLIGSPTRVLLRFAETHETDIIVMGRIHRRRLGSLLGSTTERLLYKMPCSLTVISPPDILEAVY
jgi:universal stress protein E